MTTDWTTIARMDQSARLAAFLRDAMYAGIPVKKAAIVAAISVNESGVLPFMPPNNDCLPAACYPLRQILRQERGLVNSKFKTIGANSKLYYLERGYLKGDETEGYYLELGQNQHSDSLTAQLTKVVDAFEFALANNDVGIIKLFSIGMTQMYLALSPLAGGSVASRFKTRDLLWQFYTSQTVKTQFDTGAYDYLSTSVSFYPTASATIDQVKQYLTNYQTGAVDWSSSAWAKYAASAQNNVKWVWSVCDQLGYK